MMARTRVSATAIEYIQQASAISSMPSSMVCAMLGALAYRNGFQAFMISGDYENKIINMGKAKRLLNWEPLARPQG